jgi:integrase/recombinase XerD
MARIPAPRDRDDEVMPFMDAQVEALLRAAQKGRNARRDEAILLVLLDTGMRAQELCSLHFSDVDFSNRQMTIWEGKGKKSRPVYIGKATTKALWRYVQEDGRDEDDALFFSMRGDSLTYNGLAMLFKRLGRTAGVKKAHPHRLRHTFAVSFLRNGGNQFTLMRLLGHTTLAVTNRYVQLAQADVERQHRQFSPADRMRGKGK